MKRYPSIPWVDRVVIALALLKLAVTAIVVHSAFAERAEAVAHEVAAVEFDGGTR